MTLVVHTADVHLSESHPERTSALETVIETAESMGADAVTIGGDLFHNPRDVDAIRPTLRNDIFADREVDIIVIPGNHDREGFRGDTHFGDSCTTLLDEPFEQVEVGNGGLRITGVPFIDRPEDSLLVSLAERERFDGPEAVMLHCTLDVGIASASMGDETERRYFPVTPDELTELEFEYVLAGHFHQPRLERLEYGTFVYPGTPASTTRTETERRQVVTVDVTDDSVGFETIPSFHHLERSFQVYPGQEDELIESVARWVDQNDDANAEVHVTVVGFHELDEADFNDRLDTASGAASVADETVTVGRLRSHELYREFDRRLTNAEIDEPTATAVRARVLDAFIRIRGDL